MTCTFSDPVTYLLETPTSATDSFSFQTVECDTATTSGQLVDYESMSDFFTLIYFPLGVALFFISFYIGTLYVRR